MIEEMTDTVIQVPSNCSIGSLEKTFKHFYKNNTPKDSLIIDLSDVTYFEVPSLIFLVGFIDDKTSKGINVRLALPQDKEQRNLLRFFRLPTILTELTNKKFQDLVVADSLKWFGENRNLQGDYWDYLNKNKKKDDETLIECIAKNKIYSEAVPFETDFDKTNAVQKMHSDWAGEEIQAFLKTHLLDYQDNKEKLIPNRIIYECVTNSVRHSSARKLVFAALDKTYTVERLKDENGRVIKIKEYKRFLDISFWDSGDSIIETLSEPLSNQSIVKDPVVQSDDRTKKLQATYYVKYKGRKEYPTFINSDINVNTIKSDRGLILLSSFFPGVSRDPKGLIKWMRNPDADIENSALKHPGMGLTTLLNAAIDLLGGQVSVRTDNYFINIKKPEDITPLKKYQTLETRFDNFYQVKIENLDSAEAKLSGNMLTVRLPLKPDK